MSSDVPMPRQYTKRAASPHRSDKALSAKIVSIALAFYLVGYLGTAQSEALGPLKYLIYVAPIALALTLLLPSVTALNTPGVLLLLGYLAWTILFVAAGGTVDTSEVTIIVLVILSLVPLPPLRQRYVAIMFLGSFAVMLASIALSPNSSLRLLEMFRAGTGSGMVEAYNSNEGLLGPIYAVFFYAVGSKILFLLSVVMSVFGGKRIGLLALLAGFGFLFTATITKRFNSQRSRSVLLAIVFTVVSATAVNLTAISDWAHTSFDAVPDIEEIMLGRHKVGAALSEDISRRSLNRWLFGAGPGAAEQEVVRATDGANRLPHNDWLKVYYDYGAIGLGFVILMFSWLFSSSRTAVALAIVTAVIMATDNVLVYVMYFFPLAVMLAFGAQPHRHPATLYPGSPPGAGP